MFDNFDFTNFWEDDAYALQELGYKLPASYIWLMKQHNGGIPADTCFSLLTVQPAGQMTM